MAALHNILRQLQAQRDKAQSEVKMLDRAIIALGEGRRRGPGRPPGRGRRRRAGFSLATRRKMAAAQKARWARLKAKKT